LLPPAKRQDLKTKVQKWTKATNEKLCEFSNGVPVKRLLIEENQTSMGNSFVHSEKTKFLLDKGVDKTFVNSIGTWTTERHLKLERIMSGDKTADVCSEYDDKKSLVRTNFFDQFENFRKQHPEWNDLDVKLFWKSYEEKFHHQILVLRKQMSGLCFMHAPVVLQHYLLCIYRIKKNETLDFKMIDVALYIKDHWTGVKLERYLAYDDGGFSRDFFTEINPRVTKIDYRRYFDVI
jgi:hypothetical protein